MWVLHWMQSAVAEGASMGAHLLVFHRLDQGIALAGVSRALAHGRSVAVQALAACDTRYPVHILHVCHRCHILWDALCWRPMGNMDRGEAPWRCGSLVKGQSLVGEACLGVCQISAL